MSLQDDINLAIEKQLPAELGTALKKRLLRLDEAEVENTALKKRVDALQVDLKQVQELNATQNKALAGHVALEIREKAVQAREEKVTVFELKAELEAEKRVAAGYKEILGGLVRNIEYRNQVFESKTTLVPSGGSYPHQHTDSKTEEKVAK